MNLNEWQMDQLGCECIVHRYHVAHLCECGSVLDHSQGTWDRHRDHQMIDFDPKEYRHAATFEQVFDRLSALGSLPYGTEGFEAVYARSS